MKSVYKKLVFVASLLLVIHLKYADGNFFKNLFTGWRDNMYGTNMMSPSDVHGYDFLRSPPGVKFVNYTCEKDTSTTNPCFVGWPGKVVRGSWVCRTLFDIVSGDSTTFSACVDRTQFIKTDQCGCCGGTCPSVTPCGCACNITMAPHHQTRRLGMGGGGMGGGSGMGSGTGGGMGGGSGAGSGTGVHHGGTHTKPRPHTGTHTGSSTGSHSYYSTQTSGMSNGKYSMGNGMMDGGSMHNGGFYGGMNLTGVLVQVDDEIMCVPPNMSVKMITGPGFFERATCVEQCS